MSTKKNCVGAFRGGPSPHSQRLEGLNRSKGGPAPGEGATKTPHPRSTATSHKPCRKRTLLSLSPSACQHKNYPPQTPQTPHRQASPGGRPIVKKTTSNKKQENNPQKKKKALEKEKRLPSGPPFAEGYSPKRRVHLKSTTFPTRLGTHYHQLQTGPNTRPEKTKKSCPSGETSSPLLARKKKS